jgi:hypothetical protein
MSPAQLEGAAREPADDGNYSVIRRVALGLLETHSFDDEADFRAAVKDSCARLHIDYGGDPDVEVAVVSKACASALVIFDRERQARWDALENLRQRLPHLRAKSRAV